MKKTIWFLLITTVLVVLVIGCGDSNHEGEAQPPRVSEDLKGEQYKDVVTVFEKSGFTNINTEEIQDLITGWLTKDGEVEEVTVGGNSEYSKDDWFPVDTEVIVRYHTFASDDTKESDEAETVLEDTETKATEEEKESAVTESESESDTIETPSAESVNYSTNTRDTVGNGNSGVYAYKSRGGSYELYDIIDLDEGYVYSFSEGNGNDECEKIRIESGDLNSVMVITYHDGDDEWSYGFHFKYVGNPDHLIMQDNDGFEYDYYPTGLEEALKIRDSKSVKDY